MTIRDGWVLSDTARSDVDCGEAGDKDLSVTLLDMPARERIEGRSPERLTSSQAETRVVPGTAHRVIDESAICQ